MDAEIDRVVESARIANRLFETLVREQPNDVLHWLRSNFAKAGYDWDSVREWLDLSPEERTQRIDESMRARH